MSELEIPESWASTTLGLIVEFLDSRRKPLAANLRKEGPYPYYGANGIQGYHNEYIFDEDLLLLAEDGGHFGSKTKDIAYTISGKSWVNNHAHVLRTKQGVSLRYLFHYLRKFNVKPFVTGSTVPKLNQEKSRQIPVLIPPLGEQKRIVDKIESCFSKIDAIEKSVDTAETLLKKYRESLLAKAFRGELVPQDPKDEPASKLLERIRTERDKSSDGKKRKKDELPPIDPDEVPFAIPKSWEWVRLGDLIEKTQLGLVRSSSEQHPSAPVKYLRMGDYNFDGEFEFTQLACVHTSSEELSAFSLSAGDFLFNTRNSLKLVGKVAVVKKDHPQPMIFNNNLMRVTFTKALETEFVFLAFQSAAIRAQLEKIKSGTTSVAAIYGRDLERILIPIPPIGEQSRIVGAVAAQLQSLKCHAATFADLRRYGRKAKESILHAAFSGRLVPHDPSEGTGHDLLANITASQTLAAPQEPLDSKCKSALRRKS